MEAYEEFEKRMSEKYPRYFGEDKRYGGFAIGEGWYKIIESLVAQIDSYTKWKRNTRAYQLRYNRAKKRGYDAMLKFVLKGKDAELAAHWQIEQVERNMEDNFLNVVDSVEYIRVVQIKEKFGGLRFYFDGGNEYIRGLVDMAETWAGHTCEKCGEVGYQRGGGWIRTLCDFHEAEYQIKNFKSLSENDDV